MSQRAKLITGGVAGLVLIVLAAWYFIFRDTAPEAVTLEGAVGALTTSTTTETGGTTSTSGGVTTTAPGADGEGAQLLDGAWSIDTSRGGGVVEDGSFVGYRVREELANVGAITAVGRSTALTGTFSFAGSTLTAAEILVDMTQLTSDRSSRDGQMRTQALETNTFPEASFTLTTPVELGAVPAPNQPFQADVTGDLTIHGVTRLVTIPIEGQLIDDTVVVVGSTEILFDDYDIERPRAAIVLSVEEQGVMEFQLFLTKS